MFSCVDPACIEFSDIYPRELHAYIQSSNLHCRASVYIICFCSCFCGAIFCLQFYSIASSKEVMRLNKYKSSCSPSDKFRSSHYLRDGKRVRDTRPNMDHGQRRLTRSSPGKNDARYVFFSSFSHTSCSFHLLDKPWSQVSSLLPPGSCLQLLSRIGFSNLTARGFFMECC